MALTKKQLANSIHSKLGLSKRESADIVDCFFDILKDNLKKGNSVKLPLFGSLYVKKRSPRKARNPSTGETVEVPPRNETVFKSSRVLRAETNSKPD